MFKKLFRALFAVIMLVIAVACVAYAWVVTFVEYKDAIDDLPVTSKSLSIGSEMLAYQEIDNHAQKTVIFIGGLSGWAETWERTIQALNAKRTDYNYIAFDLPPFGYSVPDPSRGYFRDIQADRIGTLVKGLGLKDVTLVGHSYGAGPATEYALRGTAEVKRLIIIDGVLNMDEMKEKPSKYGIVQIDFLRTALVALLAHSDSFVGSRLKMFVYSPESINAALVAIYTRSFDVKGTSPKLSWWLKDYTNDPLSYPSASSQAYRGLAIPVRLIWGDKDTVTPIGLAQKVLDAVPDGKLYPLRDVGHIPMIEKHEPFDDALLEALSE